MSGTIQVTSETSAIPLSEANLLIDGILSTLGMEHRTLPDLPEAVVINACRQIFYRVAVKRKLMKALGPTCRHDDDFRLAVHMLVTYRTTDMREKFPTCWGEVSVERQTLANRLVEVMMSSAKGACAFGSVFLKNAGESDWSEILSAMMASNSNVATVVTQHKYN